MEPKSDKSGQQTGLQKFLQGTKVRILALLSGQNNEHIQNVLNTVKDGVTAGVDQVQIGWQKIAAAFD